MKSIITFAFALIVISVHPPLLDGSSVAAAVGDYIAEAWKWAELPILFLFTIFGIGSVDSMWHTVWQKLSTRYRLC